MLVEIFVMVETIAFLMLLVSFIRINDYRNWLLSFISAVLFIFLSIQSFQIQTDNCRTLVANSTSVDENITSYGYTYDCQVNTFKDTNLGWVNIAFIFISLLYGVGSIFIKKWHA